LYRGKTTESNGTFSKTYNIYHLRKRASVIPATEAALAAAVASAIEGNLNNAYSVTYTAIDVLTRFMDDPARLGVISANGIVATVSGDRLPSRDAVYFKMTTNGRGRSFLGSKHFSPVAESSTTLDNLNTTGLGLWNSVGAGIIALNALVDGDGNTWDLIVLSQLLSNLTAFPALFTGAYVTAVDLSPVIGTMKRRRQKAA
jgi:hypothetical protein